MQAVRWRSEVSFPRIQFHVFSTPPPHGEAVAGARLGVPSWSAGMDGIAFNSGEGAIRVVVSGLRLRPIRLGDGHGVVAEVSFLFAMRWDQGWMWDLILNSSDEMPLHC